MKHLIAGVFSSVLGMGALFGGFYLLYLGFLRSDVVIGIVGGIAIPLGTWLTSRARKTQTGSRR